jgi:hypothetical protein
MIVIKIDDDTDNDYDDKWRVDQVVCVVCGFKGMIIALLLILLSP